MVYFRGCLSAMLTLFTFMESLDALPHAGFEALAEMQDGGPCKPLRTRVAGGSTGVTAFALRKCQVAPWPTG